MILHYGAAQYSSQIFIKKLIVLWLLTKEHDCNDARKSSSIIQKFPKSMNLLIGNE